MALLKSKVATGVKPVSTLMAALTAGLLYEFTNAAVLAAGDIIDMGPIPAGAQPVDVTLIAEDLDTSATPAITLTVGILTADKTDIATAFIAASTVGQAGGVARATTADCYSAGASSTERRLGVKVVAAPATGAVSKKIAVVLDAIG